MNPLKLLFSLGLTILLWAAAPAVSSQTCTAFYPLEDATGIEFLQTHQIESLNEAACSLRAALPQEFQSDFAVYDLGFYSHHISYEGGIPDVLQQVIDGLTTDYYLIFGREMNRDEELEKVWVEMGLPEGGGFSCWTETNWILSKNSLNVLVDSLLYELNGNSVFTIDNLIIPSINKAYELVTEILECCSATNSLCAECPGPEEILNYYRSEGYSEEKIQLLVDSTQ